MKASLFSLFEATGTHKAGIFNPHNDDRLEFVSYFVNGCKIELLEKMNSHGNNVFSDVSDV